MFPFYADAQAGAILEMFLLIVTCVVWFASLLTCGRC